MGVTILWIIAVTFTVISLYLLAFVAMIACKRLFPHADAVVEKVALAEWRVPKSSQVYLSVRYTSNGKSDHFKLLFWGANRARIERSGRYRKLLKFYDPGRAFRVYKLPFGTESGIVPECPVVRVETALVLLGTFTCVSVSTGAFLALSGV